jgi:hypothetical protein
MQRLEAEVLSLNPLDLDTMQQMFSSFTQVLPSPTFPPLELDA